jgi:7-carboxy-7-deazaguanine synthase
MRERVAYTLPAAHDRPAMPPLTVSEIFTSLQGETTEQGRPCTFVRLTACDLRCTWCDTPHAFTGGSRRAVEDVVAEVRERGVRFVTVTGGEPLLQAASADLVRALLDDGFEVQVETGGHRDVTVLDRRARIILDLKAPDSGEHASIRWENLAELLPHDQVKLVLASRRDYEWARDLRRGALAGFPTVLLQPVTGVLAPAELAGWILEDRLDVRFTLQLHAVLWPGRTGV